MRLYFCIISILCCNLFASEQKDWTATVENYFQGLQEYEADIIQESDNMKRNLSGKIRIHRPILRIDLEDGRVVIINGNKIKYYNAKLNDTTEHNKNPFSVFLRKNIQLKKHVTIKSTKVHENKLYFRVRPNVDVGADIELVFDLRNNELELKKWIIIYDNGNNVSIKMTNVKDKLSIQNSEFEKL